MSASRDPFLSGQGPFGSPSALSSLLLWSHSGRRGRIRPCSRDIDGVTWRIGYMLASSRRTTAGKDSVSTHFHLCFNITLPDASISGLTFILRVRHI